jgi:hypothetical protein
MRDRLAIGAAIMAIWAIQTMIFVVTFGATGRFAWAVACRFVL